MTHSDEIEAAIRGGYMTRSEADRQYGRAPPELALVDGNYGMPAPDVPFEIPADFAMNARRTLELELPPIEQICGPLHSCGVLMIAGMAGVGKSLFALGLAAHIAAGKNFAGWHTPEARPVFYIDGEMSTQYLQSRLKKLPICNELGMAHLESMRASGASADFSQARWRDAFINSYIFECYEVFIFDTVSSLLLAHTEGEMFSPEYWLQLETFHQAFRSHNKTVIWVDNLNKRGEVFGTALKHHKVDSMWHFTKWDACPYLHTAAFEMSQGKMRGDHIEAEGQWYFHPDNGWNTG